MFKIGKTVTVEEIHKAFDDAEDQIILQCQKVVNELNIPTETQLERKVELLKKIGFINSETVQKAEVFFEDKRKIISEIKLNQLQIDTINELKLKYPNEKFITVDVLNNLCEKYGLIHAPIGNYIKDVPEKNLLEIANCKKLEDEDNDSFKIKLIGLKSDYVLKLFNKEEPIFSLDDLKRINYGFFDTLEEWFKDGDTTWLFCAVKYGIDGKESNYTGSDQYSFKKIERIDKTGYFIAAPKSHFDLKDLKQKSKFGFFKTEIIESKDPIVFQYCKNNMIRIITKWGTDDDQSYLDPTLTNESFN